VGSDVDESPEKPERYAVPPEIPGPHLLSLKRHRGGAGEPLLHVRCQRQPKPGSGPCFV